MSTHSSYSSWNWDRPIYLRDYEEKVLFENTLQHDSTRATILEFCLNQETIWEIMPTMTNPIITEKALSLLSLQNVAQRKIREAAEKENEINNSRTKADREQLNSRGVDPHPLGIAWPPLVGRTDDLIYAILLAELFEKPSNEPNTNNETISSDLKIQREVVSEDFILMNCIRENDVKELRNLMNHIPPTIRHLFEAVTRSHGQAVNAILEKGQKEHFDHSPELAGRCLLAVLANGEYSQVRKMLSLDMQPDNEILTLAISERHLPTVQHILDAGLIPDKSILKCTGFNKLSKELMQRIQNAIETIEDVEATEESAVNNDGEWGSVDW